MKSIRLDMEMMWNQIMPDWQKKIIEYRWELEHSDPSGDSRLIDFSPEYQDYNEDEE